MIEVDRRAVLIGGAAALGGCVTGLTARNDGRRLGLADITVMPDLLRDYPGTLRRVAAMGYTTMGVRLVGYRGVPDPGEPPALDKARMVRDAGLELGVVRLGVRNADYDRQLDDAVVMGARIVAMTTAPPFISGPRVRETTRAAFDAWLPQLVALGEKAKARGLILAYHNHWYDFVPLDGVRPFDLMVQQVPPALLSFEIDLAWTWYAGIAPLDLLTRLGPRVVSMHWKDVDRSHGKEASEHAVAPGKGEMDYARLLPRIHALTSAVGYVEVDKPEDGMAAAADAAAFIMAHRG